MALLELDGLAKTYGDKVALAGLTCRIEAGEIVGLLGPNGAGKTTTMRLLLGLLRPSSGRAFFDGLDCTHDSVEVRRRLGYTPDEPAFFDYLTGRESLELVTTVRDLPRDEVWARLSEYSARIDFEPHIDEQVGGYSHGTKKKLALLCALAHAPKLLLLDEPTNGLDPAAASRVRGLLRELAGKGAAIVVSTHMLDMADKLCHRVLVLHKGRPLAQGTPSEVRALAGVPLDASLEDAYLALVQG
jgi:ABC-2 type transport system ATP-binding protein